MWLAAKGLFALLPTHQGQAIDPYDDAREDVSEIRAAIDELIANGYAARAKREVNRPRFDAVSFRAWKEDVDYAEEDSGGDHLDEYPNLTSACETVSGRLGFGAESLRRWVRQAHGDVRYGHKAELLHRSCRFDAHFKILIAEERGVHSRADWDAASGLRQSRDILPGHLQRVVTDELE